MTKHGSQTTYVIGFLASVAVTLAAYLLTVGRVLHPDGLGLGVVVGLVVLLALAQLAVQLRLFLHLGDEPRPRWNLLAFGFMALVLAILVLGSLWIMANLSYHMPTPQQIDHSTAQDEGIHL